MDLGDLRSMEGERAWKEIMAGSRRDAEVTKETSPRHEAVREIDPWWYEVSLPDVDPVFQSSCCGNSYSKATHRVQVVGMSLILRHNSCMRDKVYDIAFCRGPSPAQQRRRPLSTWDKEESLQRDAL
jgi:hypothetical protein